MATYSEPAAKGSRRHAVSSSDSREDTVDRRVRATREEVGGGAGGGSRKVYAQRDRGHHYERSNSEEATTIRDFPSDDVSRGHVKERLDGEETRRVRRNRSVSRSRSRSQGRRSRSDSNGRYHRYVRDDHSHYDDRVRSSDYHHSFERGSRRRNDIERFTSADTRRGQDYSHRHSHHYGSSYDGGSLERRRYDRSNRNDRSWDNRGGRMERNDTRQRRDLSKEKCFNCLQFGHWARDCPDTEGRDRCFHCRKPGHMARNCPDKTQMKEDDRRYDERRFEDRRYTRSRSR